MKTPIEALKFEIRILHNTLYYVEKSKSSKAEKAITEIHNSIKDFEKAIEVLEYSEQIMNDMKFSAGDIISLKGHKDSDRKILKVFPGSYDWEYVSIPGKMFNSLSSNDPLFENWEKVK